MSDDIIITKSDIRIKGVSNKLSKFIIDNKVDEHEFGVEALGKYVKNGDTTFSEKEMQYYNKDILTKEKFGSDHSPAISMCQPIANQIQKIIQQALSLNLHKGNGKTVYMQLTESTWISDARWQNKFCHFLYTLSNEYEVEILIGNGVGGAEPSCAMGCIFDAMMNSAVNVRASMCGRGGMVESCMWLHGKEKVITPYGALTFAGVGRLVEMYPQWRAYYETIFTKGLHIDMFTESDVETLLTTNSLIYIGYENALNAITK